MAKIELRFKTDHADLFRNENDELVVHLVGVDEAEVMTAIAGFHTALDAAVKARENDVKKSAALDKLLSEQVEG